MGNQRPDTESRPDPETDQPVCRSSFVVLMNSVLAFIDEPPITIPVLFGEGARATCPIEICEPFLAALNGPVGVDTYRTFASEARFEVPLPTLVDKEGISGAYEGIFEAFRWSFPNSVMSWEIDEASRTAVLRVDRWPVAIERWMSFLILATTTVPTLVGIEVDAEVRILEASESSAEIAVDWSRVEQAASIASAKRLALGDISSAIAHEINNPLAIISSSIDYADSMLAKGLEAVERPADSESVTIDAETWNALRSSLLDSREALSDAFVGVRRTARFVRSLRSFADALEWRHNSEIDVNESIQTVLDVSGRELFEPRSVICRFEDVPPVSVEGSFEQAVLGLLKNAAQATQESADRRVWVRTYTDENFGVIEVEDRGEGFTDEALERAVEPFFTTRASGVGSGLGLTVADRIATASGGALEIDTSAPGVTVVRVSLPLADSSAP